ncbi:hypothetical protein CTRI78_v000685 [Colletotrichum trifolii]|uniref:Uncharacterized protein n=1 Tax=Colletotrichum trifolii TaxID=5466 RepID=A0A4R8RRS7_COLTR|nr:hypothetical protein CTRI78_v000685 [Colletotrichum trifolii]
MGPVSRQNVRRLGQLAKRFPVAVLRLGLKRSRISLSGNEVHEIECNARRRPCQIAQDLRFEKVSAKRRPTPGAGPVVRAAGIGIHSGAGSTSECEDMRRRIASFPWADTTNIATSEIC